MGKWKPVILLQLISNGTMRFSELQQSIPDINKRELEYYDIVHREVYNQIPPLNKARQMVATSRSTGKTV
ncbi:winged helix-turn-helix transcriptional regulator [Paenibacillus lautus]|uniref:winged helix-turn-helix transcriptional regulator n=1 Tax=Paenibacillus lautus TaxID=1401 RepID=UPI003D9A2641